MFRINDQHVGCGLVFFILLGHIFYKILLFRLRILNLPIDTKSSGMGFEKNFYTYIKYVYKKQGCLDVLSWAILFCIAGSLMCALLIAV